MTDNEKTFWKIFISVGTIVVAIAFIMYSYGSNRLL